MAVFFQVLLFIIGNWKEIRDLIKAIIELVKQMDDKSQVKAVQAELVAAVQIYEKTKDKRPLEKLLCRLKSCDVPK